MPTKDYTTIQSKKFESKIFIQDFVQIVDITLEAFLNHTNLIQKFYQKKKNGTKRLQNSFGNLIYS